MVTDTSKDALAHPANDAGRIAGALVHAELDVFAAEEEGASAEEDGAGLGCDACAGAALGEEEGDGLVEEGLGGETELGALALEDGALRVEPGTGDLLEVV